MPATQATLDFATDSEYASLAPPWLLTVHANLEQWFETDLVVLDLTTDTAVDLNCEATPALPAHWFELCRQVALRGRPEFIACDDPFLALAFPIPDNEDCPRVAVGLFLSDAWKSGDKCAMLGRLLGWSDDEVDRWAVRQQPWRASRLLTLAESIYARLATELQVQNHATEVHALSANIAAVYEEVSLLHRLTQHLRISESDEDLGRLALEWLGETVPAESLVLELSPVP